MKRKSRRYKFSSKDIRSMQKHYEDYGWKVMWIALLFQVHRRTVQFHIRARGWIRRVDILNVIPEKIAKIYRNRNKIKYLDQAYKDTKQIKRKLVEGSYEYIRHMAEQQRLRNCQHVRWIKRCSICGMILESDAIDHLHSIEMPNKPL